MNPPASKWFEAPTPVRPNIHSRPIRGLWRCLSHGAIETGCFDSCWM
jgi:hypothetical protein